jgi:uncharacterized protein (DUF433 family)
MSDRESMVKSLLEDIREGMNDEALMNKHELSAKELQSILAELDEAGFIVKIGQHYEIPCMRSIAAGDIISDIRSGTNSVELMEKYGLTTQALANTLRLLMDGNHLSRADMAGRERLFQEVMDPGSAREHRRYYLDFELPIVEAANGAKGRVRDLTDKGLGIIGIPALINDVKRFSIHHEKFALIKPFSFEARCCWANQKQSEAEYVAGFEIIDISPEDFDELQKLVRLVTFYESSVTQVPFEDPSV